MIRQPIEQNCIDSDDLNVFNDNSFKLKLNLDLAFKKEYSYLSTE